MTTNTMYQYSGVFLSPDGTRDLQDVVNNVEEAALLCYTVLCQRCSDAVELIRVDRAGKEELLHRRPALPG